jgi:hypothetical protein
MTDSKTQDWHKPYQDAVSETDARRLPQVIAAAENLLFLRWRELPGSANERSERVAIHDALNHLRLLKTNKRRAHGSPAQAGASGLPPNRDKTSRTG